MYMQREWKVGWVGRDVMCGSQGGQTCEMYDWQAYD